MCVYACIYVYACMSVQVQACVCVLCLHMYVPVYMPMCTNVHIMCVYYPPESVGTHTCTYMQRPEKDMCC